MVRGPQQVCCPGGEQAASTRLIVPPIDHLDNRPASSLISPGDAQDPVCRMKRGKRRCRADQQARHSGPSGPLDGNVPGMPGRISLLLQRLVMLVQHHNSIKRRGGCPHRRPRTDNHPSGWTAGPTGRMVMDPEAGSAEL